MGVFVYVDGVSEAPVRRGFISSSGVVVGYLDGIVKIGSETEREAGKPYIIDEGRANT